MLDGDIALDPDLVRYYQEQEQAAAERAGRQVERFVYDEPAPKSEFGRHKGWHEANGRRASVIAALRGGASVSEACKQVGVQYPTYAAWRQRIQGFAQKADEAKNFAMSRGDSHWDGTQASFHQHFFGHSPTWFQLRAIDAMSNMRRGNVLAALWPPEFGKTTTFEDHANYQLGAVDPSWRFLVAGESRELAQQIVGHVMDRMDPMGPCPDYVSQFGPFKPQSGGLDRTAWSDIRFKLHKARLADHREYSMRAIGAGSKSVLSQRTDHFHLDDIQSTASLNQTPKRVRWLRQDVFSRAGESGITTIWGSRIDETDFWEVLLNDPDLDESVFQVLMIRAIYTDHATGETKSIWPEKWPLEALDRQRRKVGQEAFDHNYLMTPGLSTKGHKTFNRNNVENCKRAEISLLQRPPAGSICYLGLDPSIGGRNCVMGVEATFDNKLIVRRIQEEVGLQSNSQVLGELGTATSFLEADGASVTDVVIEAMAFQKGLMNDETLFELRKKHGWSVRDHLTGWNKYDADIGIPSMAKDFIEGKIVLPNAEDEYTRFLVGQLCAQLYAWKPGIKGNVLRQDMVMALWFCWIVWRERYKEPTEAKSDQSGFKTQGLPYAKTDAGIWVPAA